MFFVLSNHDIVLTTIDFTENIMSEVCVYERSKSLKEILILKCGTSFVAAGILVIILNITQYSPANIFSEMYKSSVQINKIILHPIDKISEGMRSIASLF